MPSDQLNNPASFARADEQNRPGPVYVCLTVFVLAFVVASAVTDVFKCCMDTIFVCSFKDMEEHNVRAT